MTQQLSLPPRPQIREEVLVKIDLAPEELGPGPPVAVLQGLGVVARDSRTPSPADEIVRELAPEVAGPWCRGEKERIINCSSRKGTKSPVQEKIAMFTQGPSKSDDPSKLGEDEYGRPVVGSKTEARGMRAHAHVFKEIMELCEIIHSEGLIRFRDEDGDQRIGIMFGDLFRIYTIISDKCVGLLLRARKHHLVTFEGETLFQKRDDNTPIFLMKSIKDIREALFPTARGDEDTVPWHTGVTSSAT